MQRVLGERHVDHLCGSTHCGISHRSAGGLAASANNRIRDAGRPAFLDVKFRTRPPSPAPIASPNSITYACLFYHVDVDATIRSGPAGPWLVAAPRPRALPHASPRPHITHHGWNPQL